MPADLKDQIHDLMQRGTYPVSAELIMGRDRGTAAGSPRVPRSWRTPGRVAAIAAGFVAVACAGAVAVTQLGGPARSAGPAPGRKPAVALTAAYVRHLASTSRLALAQSGRAVVRSQQAQDGVLQNTATYDITFNGQNWNDAFSEVMAGLGGQPATTQSAVNRVVNGQAYDFFNAVDGTRWYHVTGPDAVSSLKIPDPRDLLAALAPAARFVAAGHTVLAGVPVTRLVATDPAAVPTGTSTIWPAGTVTAFTVWVDNSGVVRQLSVASADQVHGVIGTLPESERKLLQEFLAKIAQVEASQHVSSAQAARIVAATPLGQQVRKERLTQLITLATTTTVDFSGIGQPQVIQPPVGAIPISAVG